MLIKTLCDYYDILEKDGKIPPDGYTRQNIDYLVTLTEDGKIDGIINYQEQKEIKEKWILLPKRTEKSAIDANIIEHRSLYIFGLNDENGKLTPNDKTKKAQKSHEAFVKANLEFLDGLHSPVIDAFRAFILGWEAEKEVENPKLLALEKKYAKSSYAFCLTGYPDRILSDDKLVREKWERYLETNLSEDNTKEEIQCAISGEKSSIARIHNKIRGVAGGLSTGSVLIGFNNESECSYGNEQSYNSNISQKYMKKYTESLNYLLSSLKHKIVLDDVTIVFWAMNSNEKCEDLFSFVLGSPQKGKDSEQTEDMLKNIFRSAKNGELVEKQLNSIDSIQSEVYFYILGIKPNSSRISIKFLYQKQFADMLWNIVEYQKDLQVSEEIHPIPLSMIRKELKIPESKNDKVVSEIITKLFHAILYHSAYPDLLFETVVRRVKIDSDIKINSVRAGIIKACINRKEKGAIQVGLNEENTNQAYLCGRLFAVLEKLQEEASGGSLNRTIKDSYFSSAASNPAVIFPKLLKLSQYHLRSKNVKYPSFYNKQVCEIMDALEDEFPTSLPLIEQGKFIIGYYQQYQSNFKKKNQSDEKQESDKSKNERSIENGAE